MNNPHLPSANTAIRQRLSQHEAHWQRFGVHRATRQAELPAMSTGWAALDQLLPVPTRYVAVWSSRGEEPLTLWMAVPPTKDFAALGVVATAGTTANLPPFVS